MPRKWKGLSLSRVWAQRCEDKTECWFWIAIIINIHNLFKIVIISSIVTPNRSNSNSYSQPSVVKQLSHWMQVATQSWSVEIPPRWVHYMITCWIWSYLLFWLSTSMEVLIDETGGRLLDAPDVASKWSEQWWAQAYLWIFPGTRPSHDELMSWHISSSQNLRAPPEL